MKDFFAVLAGSLLFAGLVALYCWATPDQMSAECDYARAQMEKGAR